MNYRDIPFKEYQDTAITILREHGFDRFSNIPVDPEVIIRRRGIRLIPWKDLKRDWAILGCVVKYEQGLQILIDEYHYFEQPESSLFTLGEELGHIELHLIDLDSITSIKKWINTLSKNDKYHKYIEQQAKCFSSHLILPNFIFESYTLDWTKKHIKEINKFRSFSHDGLANLIGSLITDDLEVSEYIISLALLRWPDRIIDKIVKQYPQILSRRLDSI